MTSKKQNFKINGVTSDDIAALNRTDEILTRIQNAYTESDVLMSETDGEVIKIEELARVRGILSFLKNNQTVVVNPSFN